MCEFSQTDRGGVATYLGVNKVIEGQALVGLLGAAIATLFVSSRPNPPG